MRLCTSIDTDLCSAATGTGWSDAEVLRDGGVGSPQGNKAMDGMQGGSGDVVGGPWVRF